MIQKQQRNSIQLLIQVKFKAFPSCIESFMVKFIFLALKMCNSSKGNQKISDLDDLVLNLSGPITEDAIMKTLHSRFIEKKYFVKTKKRF